VRVKLIKALFVPNHQKNKQECRKTHGQPGNIDNRVSFVANNIAPCDLEIIPEHIFRFNLS
jgi:hypothetical protein